MFSSKENPTHTEINEENIHLQQLIALSAFIDEKINYILSLNASVAANYIDELCQELNGISAKAHELKQLVIDIGNQFIEDPKIFYRDDNEKFNKIISDILLKNSISSLEEIDKLENELQEIYSNLYNNLVALLGNLNKFYSSVSEIISTIQTLSINNVESKKEQIQRAISDEEVSTAVIEALTEINHILINYTNIQSKDLTNELFEKSALQEKYKRQLQQLPENIEHQYRQATAKLEEQKALPHQSQGDNDQSQSSTIYFVQAPHPTQLPETEITEGEYSEFTPEEEPHDHHSTPEQITSYSTGKIMGTLLGTMLGSGPGGAFVFASYMLLTTWYDEIKLPIELAIALCAAIGTVSVGGAGFIGGHMLDKSRNEKRENEHHQLSIPTPKELETLSSNVPPNDIEAGYDKPGSSTLYRPLRPDANTAAASFSSLTYTP